MKFERVSCLWGNSAAVLSRDSAERSYKQVVIRVWLVSVRARRHRGGFSSPPAVEWSPEEHLLENVELRGNKRGPKPQGDQIGIEEGEAGVGVGYRIALRIPTRPTAAQHSHDGEPLGTHLHPHQMVSDEAGTESAVQQGYARHHRHRQ